MSKLVKLFILVLVSTWLNAVEIDLSGSVVSDNQKMITSRYMGYVKNMAVSEGDIVKKGQLLGILDASPDRDFCHIHWSITKDGEYISPYDCCSEKAKSQME